MDRFEHNISPDIFLSDFALATYLEADKNSLFRRNFES